MNFYKHHLGDYAAATAHLSWDEDCSYRRLLDQYYKREAALPADLKETCRLVRAVSSSQKRAVETVLGEFFRLEADGWHQKRCDEEIVAANSQAQTNRRIAEQREANRRQRTSHDSLNDSCSIRSPDTSVEREPIQTPDSRLQIEDSRREDEAPPVGTIKTQIYRLAKQLEISAGIVTNELKAHTETEVWQALGSTLSTKPAEPLAYFRGCLKVNGTERFKSA